MHHGDAGMGDYLTLYSQPVNAMQTAAAEHQSRSVLLVTARNAVG